MKSSEQFEVRQRRSVGEINIVPILDMLTTIIFFLLISASFLEYNKISVPSSKTSLADTSEVLPVQPRLLLSKTLDAQKLVLFWGGKKPGSYVQMFPLNVDIAQIAAKAAEFSNKFKTQFNTEQTIQLGLSRGFPYGNLIALLDAVRPALPNVVLVSYQDTETAASRFSGDQ